MSTATIPKNLKDALKARKVIPFAGAGVSMEVRFKVKPRRKDPPALPSWIGLLHKAATRLREEGKASEADLVEANLNVPSPKVLEAAQIARDALHTGLWSKFLVECFRLKRSELAPESLALARLLWRLGSTLLITSNYDNVLKWAAPADADPILWRVSNPFGFAQFHRGEHDDPAVWHLHGHIDDPEGLVLTPDGYAKLYGPKIEEEQYEAALESLRSLLVSHTFLFVGFSLADAAVNAQLAWLEAVFKGQGGKHFALLRQDQIPLFEARSDLQNVEPIPFTDHGPHLLALVTAMAEIVEAAAEAPARPAVAANGSASPKLIAVPHLDWPEELGIEMPDSLLLRPESAVVPFHAERRGLLQDVLDWAIGESQSIALRLQAGPGGAGKTRLMLEACRELNEEHGWAAGFLQPGADLERDLQSLLAENRDCFIVIDYAETRSRDVADLARTALHASSGSKLRLALVARDGGDWWDRLADLAGGDKVLEAILRDPATKTGPYRLSEAPLPPPARPGVFREARNAFAARKKLPAPEGAPPDLNAEHFGEILFLHLAALAALRGHDTGDDRELIETALGHERAYWRRLLTQHGLAESYLAGLEQAVALLSLLGGTRSARDARAILARTPLLRGVPGVMRDQLFEILRRLYRHDGGIGGLEPDLLAERLVAMALGADDELLDIALAEGAAPEAARHALTLLTRLARHDPAERRWLERALERHLAWRAHECFAVAMETGAPLPELLAEAIAEAPRPTRLAVINTPLPSLPKETANLTFLAIAVAQQRLLFIKEKGERKGRKAPVRLLKAYGELAFRLQASGRFKEAAEASAEALRHAQRLARSGGAEDRRNHAGALGNLSVALRRIGRFKEALAKAETAEALWRELAARQPVAHRAGWAKSLVNLAIHLHYLGRFEEALAKAETAEALWRELAARQPDAHRANWAESLTNLANRLMNLGRFEKALAKAETAEALWRELAARQPGAHRAERTRLLTNLANHLHDLGRFEEALAKAETAEALWRELAARQPDAHRADWAGSLMNLANRLGDLGRFKEALAKAETAEALWRELAARQPDAHRADWAKSLTNLANHLRDLGRFEAALIEADTAEALLRELAARQPDAHRANWAVALGNLAEIAIRCERAAVALAPAEQAVDLFSAAEARLPEVGIDRRGWSRRVLAEALLEAGEVERALAEARRAHALLLQATATRPGYIADHLAKACRTLARCLARAGEAAEGGEVLVRGIGRLAPYFAERPRALREVMRGLVDELRVLGPERLVDVPAEVLAQLEASGKA